jgi:CubicO group peptidase (beta-lactamase class C family)
MPLGFQPGTGWDYAIGADVLARVAELVTGQAFAQLLQTRIFGPLGMLDTGYVVPPEKLARLAPLYRSEDPLNALQPATQVAQDLPWPDAFVKAVPRTAGTGGLVSTQADYLRFLLQLQPGKPGLLQPATLAEMMRDQLPAQTSVQFMRTGPMPTLGFGLGGAVTRATSALQPNSRAGEFQWGGLAGTHWSIDPSRNVMIVQMAQRHFGFWQPFWFEYKAAVYQAVDQAVDQALG